MLSVFSSCIHNSVNRRYGKQSIFLLMKTELNFTLWPLERPWTLHIYPVYASLEFRACLQPNYTAIPIKWWYDVLRATRATCRRKTTLPRKNDALWLYPHCSVMMRCIVGNDYCAGHILDRLACLNICSSNWCLHFAVTSCWLKNKSSHNGKSYQILVWSLRQMVWSDDRCDKFL